MNPEFLKQYVKSMDWVNPKSRLMTRLGDHLGNGRFANSIYGNVSNLEFELSLLDNPKSDKMIGAGCDGNVFLHRDGNKVRAVKVYRAVGPSTKGTGISQFRVSRKIKQLGYETPDVFAATEDILVMDYMPYESLDSYLNKLGNKDKVYIHSKWMEQINYVWKLIGNERIDRATVNGYVKPRDYVFDLGMIDQG